MSRGPQSRHPVDDPAPAEPSRQAESDKTRGESGPGGAGSTIASLEPALWKRLTDAGGLAEAARAWLALQCQMIEGATRGIVLLAGDQANNFAAAGYWPEGSGKSAALVHAAEAALRERRGVASDDPSGTAEQHVGLPILLDDELAGAVAVTIRGSRGEDGRQALRQLQWGIAWIRERLRQARGAAQDRLLDRSRTALDLIGGALDHEGFDAAAMATVTGLALRYKCSRVSLGFREAKSTAVKVISHTAQFGQQMNLISCLEAAMDEALDQRCVILYPGAPDQLLATSAHAELSRVQQDGQVLTVPLLVGDRFVGALTFERPAGSPFEPETIGLLENVTAAIGPLLEERRQNDRWIFVKIGESVHLQLTRLVGPGHLARKLIVAALVAVALILTFVRPTYRVDADAKIEGLVRRAVVAPYDGFIK
ncbi:MAG TPA: GAF domain-containing protein, partial [Pirellulales bacterium]|nr:GAF domain-containing protein [Pirellulales bacterium]